MGFAPAACAVVEDTPSGVTAARRAGMTVYGLAADSDARALARCGRDRRAGARRSCAGRCRASRGGDCQFADWSAGVDGLTTSKPSGTLPPARVEGPCRDAEEESVTSWLFRVPLRLSATAVAIGACAALLIGVATASAQQTGPPVKSAPARDQGQDARRLEAESASRASGRARNRSPTPTAGNAATPPAPNANRSPAPPPTSTA